MKSADAMTQIAFRTAESETENMLHVSILCKLKLE